MRSVSFCSSSLAFAKAPGENSNPASAPANTIEPVFTLIPFISTASFESKNWPRRVRFGRLLRAFVCNEQHHSTDQRKGSQDGRKRYGVVLALGGLNWPNVQHLFLCGVSKATINQSHDTDY